MKKLDKNVAAVIIPAVDQMHENKYNYCF